MAPERNPETRDPETLGKVPGIQMDLEPLPTVEVDGAEHSICSVNEAFCELMRRPKQEMLGRPFADIVPGGTECVPTLNEAYETGEAKAFAQADHADSGGTYWLFAVWPELEIARRPRGIIIQVTRARLRRHHRALAIQESLLIAGLQQHTLREEAEALNTQLHAEIAERRKVELELTKTLQELQQAHWAAERATGAKDRFFAALSHELRTPMTPVLLMASALAEDSSVPDDARAHLKMMRRNIQLQTRLIDDLLDMTRITSGKLRMSTNVADLHEVIRFTEGIISNESLAPAVKVVFALEAPRHHALVDTVRMHQVFWNVIRNALKFTPAGGSVTVTTWNDRADKILIRITDTGIGITAEALPNVFNAFEQGKTATQRYGGLGMGLFIARTIVVEHGGTIVVESEGEGRGAAFTITLPCVAETVRKPVLMVEAPASHRALRVLLVEDHVVTREILAKLLARAGHAVSTAGTVQDALAMFAVGAIDVVISDLGLPDGSGVELMQKMHRIRLIPAIAISGYGMEEDLVRTKEAGFIAHLIKPIHLEELLSVLDQVAGAEVGG